jgi:hypothetical protein
VAQLDAAIERVEPAIPLPPPPHEFDARAAEELGPGQPASAAALPSCAFLTFVNTAQALNCAAFSPDGSAVAGASPPCGPLSASSHFAGLTGIAPVSLFSS